METLNKFTVWAIYSMYFAKTAQEHVRMWPGIVQAIAEDGETMEDIGKYAAIAVAHMTPKFLKIKKIKSKIEELTSEIDNLNKKIRRPSALAKEKNKLYRLQNQLKHLKEARQVRLSNDLGLSQSDVNGYVDGLNAKIRTVEKNISRINLTTNNQKIFAKVQELQEELDRSQKKLEELEKWFVVI